MRQRVPPELHGVITLLHDEDLKTFLELLLGSVMKRASLVLDQQRDEALHAEESGVIDDPDFLDVEPSDLIDTSLLLDETLTDTGPRPRIRLPEGDESVTPEVSVGADEPPSADGHGEEPGELLHVDPDLLEWTPEVEAEPSAAEAEAAGVDELAAPLEDDGADEDEIELPPEGYVVPQEVRLANLMNLEEVVRELMSSQAPQRKAFDFLHRFLVQKRRVPPQMVQSIHPYLDLLEERVLPKLEPVVLQRDLPPASLKNLQASARALRRGSLTPDDLQHDVPLHMNRIVHLLEGIVSSVSDQLKNVAPEATYWNAVAREDVSREF